MFAQYIGGGGGGGERSVAGDMTDTIETDCKHNLDLCQPVQANTNFAGGQRSRPRIVWLFCGRLGG